MNVRHQNSLIHEKNSAHSIYSLEVATSNRQKMFGASDDWGIAD